MKGGVRKLAAAFAALACAAALSLGAGAAAFAAGGEGALGALGVQASDDATWGLESIYAEQAWERVKSDVPATGQQPVCIAVIDTGFYANHPDLAGNVVATWNAAAYDADNPDATPTDVSSPAALANTAYGLNHGTHVAGVLGAVAGNGAGIDGVSYNAKLVLVRVSGDDGSVQSSSLINAFKLIRAHAAEYNIRVANLSIGIPVQAMPEKGDATSGDALLYDEIDAAFDEGIVTVCSAGNKVDGAFEPPFYNYPGDYSTAVSVIGLKRTATGVLDSHVVERDASYSNYNMPGTTSTTGTKNISAPGTKIRSATGESGYGYLTGTSQAAAFVSGTLALVFTANPSFTAEQAVNRIYETATDLGDAGWDEQTGWGEVNALRAVDPDADLSGSGEGSGADGGTSGADASGDGGTSSGGSDSDSSGDASGESQGKISIENASITLSASSFVYSGKAIRPAVKVVSGGKTLNAGSDYAVGYLDNVDAGTGRVVVSGTGAFTGAAETSFTIAKAAQHPKVTKATRTAKYAKVKKKAVSVGKILTVKGAVGKVTFKMASVSTKAMSAKVAKRKLALNSKTGKLTVKKGCKKGAYKLKVKVSAAGDANHKSFAKGVAVSLRVK